RSAVRRRDVPGVRAAHPARHRGPAEGGVSAVAVVGKIRRRLARPVARRLARRWPAYSRLLIVGDAAGWVLDREVIELTDVARRLGVRLADPRWWDGAER